MESDSTIYKLKNLFNDFKKFLLYYIPERHKNILLKDFRILEEDIKKDIISEDKYEEIRKEILFQKKYLVSYSDYYIKIYSHQDNDYNKIILHILNLPNYFSKLI